MDVTTGNITVISDWTLVTATQSQTANGWAAIDTGADTTKHYVYAIIADGEGGAKSKPAYTGESDFENSYHSLNFSVPNLTDAPRRVQLTWTKQADITYTLQYAEVQHPTIPSQNATNNNYAITSGFTDIPIPDGAIPAIPNKEAVVIYEFGETQVGKNYIFRLTATHSNGVSNTYQSDFLFDGAFSRTVYISLSSASNLTAGEVTLNITSGTGTFRGRAYTVEVYRRVTTTGQETGYQKIGEQPVAIDAASVTYVDNTVEVKDAPPYLTYSYRITVKDFGNTSPSTVVNNVSVWQ